MGKINVEYDAMTFQGENSSLTWFFPMSVIFHFFSFLGVLSLSPFTDLELPCTCAVLCSKYRTNLWG